MNKAPHAIALLAILTVAGCTTGQPQPAYIRRSLVEADPSGRTVYMEPVVPSTSRVISKNYDVGSRRVASVGEPIIGVRNYTASDVIVEAVALQDFRQICYQPRGFEKVDELSFTADQGIYAGGPQYDAGVGAPTKVDVQAIESDGGGTGSDSMSAPLEQHPADAYAEAPQASAVAENEAPRRSLITRFRRLLSADGTAARATTARTGAQPSASVSSGNEAAPTGMDEELELTLHEDGAGAAANAQMDVPAPTAQTPAATVQAPAAGAEASADGMSMDAEAPGVAHSPDTEFRLYDDSEAEARRDNITPSFAGLSDEEMKKLYCKRGLLGYVIAARGERFPVAGQFVEAGKTYYLVQLPGPGGDLFLAVDDTGHLKPERYIAWHDEDDTTKTSLGVPLEYQSVKYPIAPDQPLFFFDHRESVTAGGASQNFDLIYEGTSYDHRGMVYHMRYREYDRARPTEPIYVQDLSYSGGTGTVDVLGLRIRVHDVSDQQIIYTVQND